MSSSETPKRSLLDLFSPPDDRRRGVFGLICGLSAEEQFIDSALERFTGFGRNFRKQRGDFSLALFLDVHNQPLTELPGLYAPYPAATMPKNIKLMHAKVALLGFGLSAAGKPDYYRLIVSTGNWTREAVNNTINLVWYCDYNLTDTGDQRQNAADILEVASFLQLLAGVENAAGYYQLDVPAQDRIGRFLTGLSADVYAPKAMAPRFISNLLEQKARKVGACFLPDSLGAQVIKGFKNTKKRHNFIVCGSGYFEQVNPKDKGAEPEVLKELSGVLVEDKILTRDAYHWLAINPRTSGAAGSWIKHSDPEELTWDLCLPKHPWLNPKSAPHPFHAKYVFIGNNNEEDGSVTSGRLYLGSGNLSLQGFALAPGAGGNVEAGVIVDVDRYDDISKFCEDLGIDPEYDLDPDAIQDDFEGEDSEQPQSEIVLPPPIASCMWCSKTAKLTWKWTESNWEEVFLNGQQIQPLVTLELAMLPLSSVKLAAKRDGKLFEWTIPVFTENNTFCHPPVPPKTGREIIDALVAFPQQSSEDDDADTGEGGEGGEFPGIPAGQSGDFSELRDELDRFPLHLATTLVETIAEMNQKISLGEMPDWIAHLRRTLIEEMKPETKEQLASLGRNVFVPLLNKPGFAPNCPTIGQTSDPTLAHNIEEYKKTILGIVDDWSRQSSLSGGPKG